MLGLGRGVAAKLVATADHDDSSWSFLPVQSQDQVGLASHLLRQSCEVNFGPVQAKFLMGLQGD